MKISAFILLTMSFMGMAGCVHEHTNQVDLVNTYWKLIDINGTAIAVSDNQREPHIILNAEQRVAGSDGCNRMMGSYTLTGDNLHFTQMAGTRMACLQGAEQAQLIGTTMPQVTRYKITGDQLELHNSSGVVIARFKAVALP